MTTKASEGVLNPQSRKNYIINGNFDIWQRGTSFSIPSGVYQSEYCADRFYYNNNSTGEFSITKTSTGLSNSPNCTHIEVTTALTYGASDYLQSRQSVEGFNMKSVYGKTVTLSFKFRSNVTGKFSAAIQIRNSSGHHSIVSEFNYIQAGVWQDVQIPFNLGSVVGYPDNNAGALIHIATTSGSTQSTSTLDTMQVGANVFDSATSVNWADTVGNYIEYTQVQLEEGSVATDFEYRSISEELALCQRYCKVLTFGTHERIGSAYKFNAGEARLIVNIGGSKFRVRPTMSTSNIYSDLNLILGNTYCSVTSMNLSNAGYENCLIQLFTTNGTIGDAGTAYIHSTPFKLIMDAEL